MSPLIWQILLALVALGFIFLTYLNTKTWRWVHVTATFFVFVATVAFCIYAAMTLKTRAKWVKEHDDLEQRLAQTEEELQRVTRGEVRDVESRTESLVGLREALARLVIDRGRVWRNCIPNIDPRSGVISLITSPPPDPNDPSAQPQKKNNIAAKTIFHAFREGPIGGDQPITVPAAYIGEFKATAVTDTAVTLEPTMPLSPDQIAAGRAQGSWVLYEVCPVDGHEWFTGTPEERLGPLSLASGVPLDRLQTAPVAQPYLRDGQEADSTDPPENVWIEVRFEQEYEVPVDAPIVNSIDTEPFNSEGQAVLARLRRSASTEEVGKVMFGPKEGQIQTAVLDQQTAESLIQQGIAKLEKRIYRRKLNDYDRIFRASNERMAELNSRIRQLEQDNKAMVAAAQKADEQQKLIEELKTKVAADLEKKNYELSELTKYKQALDSRLAAVQNELSQLYLANKALGRELARRTAELTEEIDRRSREATASTR